jgi:hypothetical protein
MSEQDKGFEQRVRTALDDSVTALDADTRARLVAARSQALSQTNWLARWMPSNSWIPATAFATCAMLAVTLFISNQQPDASPQLAQTDADFALELLLSDDDLQDLDADSYIQMEAMLLLEEEHDAS